MIKKLECLEPGTTIYFMRDNKICESKIYETKIRVYGCGEMWHIETEIIYEVGFEGKEGLFSPEKIFVNKEELIEKLLIESESK